MKKLIIALCLSLSSTCFAQTSAYNSPFGGVYVGDFQSYGSDSNSTVETQEYKVNLVDIVLLNDNDTLSKNTDAKSMSNYILNLDKVLIKQFSQLSQSNKIVIEVNVKQNNHSVDFAHKNPLNKSDNNVFNNAFKKGNSVVPFKVKNPNVNIRFHIRYNIDITLPVNK